MADNLIVVPDSVRSMAENSVGAFFEGVAGTARDVNARDHIDVVRPIKKGRLLEQFTPMQGKRLLEIGSGYGTNLAVWTKMYGLDSYGTERNAEGFGCSFEGSRAIFAANGLDPDRIVPVSDNRLPFPDSSFDIVYASNVLEHTEDPVVVMEEAIRVLRPGGVFQAEVPNYLAWFEGHYFVPQPPLLFRWMLPVWVRLLGRDPAFARTMRTEINPIWSRRTVKEINRKYPVELLSLGEQIFLDRLKEPYEFEMERTAAKFGTPVRIFQLINVWNWMGHLIVLLQGYYPLYITVRRKV